MTKAVSFDSVCSPEIVSLPLVSGFAAVSKPTGRFLVVPGLSVARSVAALLETAAALDFPALPGAVFAAPERG